LFGYGFHPPPPQINIYERKIDNLSSWMLHPQYQMPLFCVFICWEKKEIKLLKILTTFFLLVLLKCYNDFTLCNILPIVILRHELLKIVFFNVLARSIVNLQENLPIENCWLFRNTKWMWRNQMSFTTMKETCTIGSQNET
jgi:hypothetical protein